MKNGNDEALLRFDANYDADLHLTGEIAHTPGYHTRVVEGARVHATRTNLDYALALLRAGTDRADRAALVIDAVLACQDPDPASKTYGIWPWFVEEPLPQMAPPDWNWADFCGARLAEILHFHSGVLAAGLVGRLRAALGHAAESIRRRDMGPHYTNIALMGAAVTAAAGALLARADLVAYARQRLTAFTVYTERHQSFNEFNSPTYTPVAIEECERAMRLSNDPEVVQLADVIRRKGWRIVADHFHGGLGEWGGPQARAYSDRLHPDTRAWLAERLDAAPDNPITCPLDCRPWFSAVPHDTWAQHVYKVDDHGAPWLRGSVWRTADACLGTINRNIFWVQSRPALGYWRAGDGSVAVFRARFLKDGVDFASAEFVGAQRENRFLSSVAFRLDHGDFHPSLDRPAAPVFSGRRWALRYQVEAPDARVEATARGYALSSGDYRVDVWPVADGRFDGQPVKWQCGRDDGGVAWVEAVCRDGASGDVDLAALGVTVLAAGCALVPASAEPAMGMVGIADGRAEWSGLTVPLS